MAILAGIDEAGFGPILGPLVVSGAAFRVPDDRLGSCLWDALALSCTKTPRRGSRRLTVTDSKRLHKPGAGIGALERTALVMLAAGGRLPPTWQTFVDEVTPDGRSLLDDYPWYGGDDFQLPITDDRAQVSTRANAVTADLRRGGIEPLGPFIEVLPEGHYNRLVSNTRNKSVVLLGLALRVVDRIMRAAPGERVRLLVDRLGGRKRYREPLTTALPGFDLQIIEETESRSAYRLRRVDRIVEIEFATKGDSRHFPVALASIYSKYVRELHMHAFNRFWCARQPDLKPTAGYYTDAKRWLDDAEASIAALAVDRALLVRRQ